MNSESHLYSALLVRQIVQQTSGPLYLQDLNMLRLKEQLLMRGSLMQDILLVIALCWDDSIIALSIFVKLLSHKVPHKPSPINLLKGFFW